MNKAIILNSYFSENKNYGKKTSNKTAAGPKRNNKINKLHKLQYLIHLFTEDSNVEIH